MDNERRSFDRFEPEDLEGLAVIAERDLAAFVARNPHHQGLGGRVLLIALCQGAARHFVDGRTGVKDFDVWTFVAEVPGCPPYPVRRRGNASYVGPRFTDSTQRVDLMGRTLPVASDADPILAVQSYLQAGRTTTARCLADKVVVVLSPRPHAGRVIWSEPT